MVYSKITLEEMFRATEKDYSSQDLAIAWVEAENIMELRSLISEWFDAMENGTAVKRFPDPRGLAVSLEEAEKMIYELDADFNEESGRWRSLGVEAGPDFFRLPSSAKIAFVQQILMTIKTVSQLEEETHERIKAGEKIPPEPFAAQQISFSYPG